MNGNTRTQVGELEAASRTMDLKAIRFASHALKGSAEACFVIGMSEARAAAP